MLIGKVVILLICAVALATSWPRSQRHRLPLSPEQ